MLSNRAKYATRAILELSKRYGQGPVPIQTVATEQNIPVKFLEQILVTLKMDGFVKSRKGPGGGYILARPPSDIYLGQVVRAIDGPLAPISCVSVYGYEECGCPHPDTCGLKRVFKAARDALAGVLDGASYASIISQGLELE